MSFPMVLTKTFGKKDLAWFKKPISVEALVGIALICPFQSKEQSILNSQ